MGAGTGTVLFPPVSVNSRIELGESKVRREIYDMILWWMEKGAGGFRLDVIDQIAKEPDQKITNNGPRLHEFIQELSRETFQKGDLITVGEAWGADIERAKLYSNPDGSEFLWCSSSSILVWISRKESRNGMWRRFQ